MEAAAVDAGSENKYCEKLRFWKNSSDSSVPRGYCQNTEPTRFAFPHGLQHVSTSQFPQQCEMSLFNGTFSLPPGVEEPEAEDCLRKGATPGGTGSLTEVPCVACNALA